MSTVGPDEVQVVRLDGGRYHGKLRPVATGADALTVRELDAVALDPYTGKPVGAYHDARYVRTVEVDDDDRPIFGYVP